MSYSQTGGNRIPSYQGDKQELWREIRKLWIRLEGLRRPAQPPQERSWSYSGIVAPVEAVSGESWRAPCALILGSITLTLTVPASVDYTVVTVIGGVDLDTASILAGDSQSIWPIQQRVPAGTLVYPRLLENQFGDGEMLGIVYGWEPETQ